MTILFCKDKASFSNIQLSLFTKSRIPPEMRSCLWKVPGDNWQQNPSHALVASFWSYIRFSSVLLPLSFGLAGENWTGGYKLGNNRGTRSNENRQSSLGMWKWTYVIFFMTCLIIWNFCHKFISTLKGTFLLSFTSNHRVIWGKLQNIKP